MMRRAATKTFSLTATAAVIAAPVLVAIASPAAAATTQELTACTAAALQNAITAGGSWDLAICAGKTINQVKQSALVDNGTTVSLSYTGSGKAPVLKFSAFGTKGSLLDVTSGNVTLTGLSLSGVTISLDPTQPTLGGAIYVASGATLTLQSDFISSSAAVGGAGTAGTAGTSASPNGTDATGDAAPGLGGAVYNAGTTNIIGSLFSSNSAVGGSGVNGGNGAAGTTGTDGAASTDPANPGQPGVAGGAGGNGGNATDGADGQGGAIYNATGGTLTINSTVFAADNAVGGKGGNGGNAANGGNGGKGGNGANATAAGAAGSAGGKGGDGGAAGTAGAAGAAGAGEGGAIYNAGTAYLNAVTTNKDTATGGAGGKGGNGADPGTGGSGGNGGNGVAGAAGASGAAGGNGGAGGAGGAVGAAGAVGNNGQPGTNGGLAEGGAVFDAGTSQIASSSFSGDTATGGAGGAGGAASTPNATSGTGGNGGTGEAAGAAGSLAATNGNGGNGGAGGAGANGTAPASAGTGGNGGAANGVTLFTTGGASVGCLTNSDATSGLTGGALGTGGAAGLGTPITTGGTGGPGGAAGTGGLVPGTAGTKGTDGTAGTTGGGAAAVGSNGTAGSTDAHLTDGTLGNLACATFNPNAVSASANVGDTVQKTITVTNSGTTNFTVSSVTVSNDPNGDLGTPTNGCTSALTPTNACTITLSITPHTAGATDSVTVNIHDNGVGGVQSVPVSVKGNQDPSGLSNRVSSNKITAGRSVIVATTVGDLVTFHPIAGETVQLESEQANASTFTAVPGGRTTTDGSGRASLTVTPVHNTSYRWVFPGGGQHATAQSSVTKVSVVRTVQIALASNSIRSGTVAEVYGTTNPHDPGVSCALQQFSHNKWKSAGATAKTKNQKLPNGSKQVGYLLKARATARGTYVLRVVCAANKLDLAGTSTKKSLLVS